MNNMSKKQAPSLKRRLFNQVLKPVSLFFRSANRVNVGLHEGTTPVYKVPLPGGNLSFYCPSSITLWRAKTLLTKEPDTIEWLDTFKPGDVLFDIGANVGLYSTYAARRGATVYSFEPESQNYALLNQNIYLNNLHDRITALNIALSSEEKINYLNIEDFQPGGSMHNFGADLDFNKEKFRPVFRQGAIGLTLDELIHRYGLPLPTHIKIDVDGLERLIIDGALKTLASPAVKSLLIELNTALKEDLEVVGILESKGFRCVKKYHAPMFEGGLFQEVYNFTFRKDR